MDEYLKQTCELLFQMHKNDKVLCVCWTRSTYQNRPANLEVAKDVLLHKKIICLKSLKQKITCLNPMVIDANSFEEADKILNKPKEIQPSVIITGNQGNVFSQSSLSGRDIATNQSVNTTPNKKNRANNNKSWYEKPFAKYILFPLLVTLIALAIAIILKNRYNLSA